ncbi:MAG: hypothetical protein KatS3mg002_1576 [Candidatus Woesearchaeota archaeon]|nr:MAG: hypothetical protein KatS3mg002_1576 [Candidatus Woesearchaeota archaeon]
MKIIGFDPGLKGGITIIDLVERALRFYTMPTNDKKIDYEKIKDIISIGDISCIILEYTRMIYGSSKQTAWEMSRQIGLIEALSACIVTKLIEVSPKVWQNYMFKNKYKDILKDIHHTETKIKSKKLFHYLINNRYKDFRIQFNEKEVISIKINKGDYRVLSCIYMDKKRREKKLRIGDGVTDSFCIACYYLERNL